MGNSEKLRDVQALLGDREKDYGPADILTGVLLTEVFRMREEIPFLFRLNICYHWIQILAKLCRLVYSPLKEDTWQDIQGYAELALRHIRGREKSNNE